MRKILLCYLFLLQSCFAFAQKDSLEHYVVQANMFKLKDAMLNTPNLDKDIRLYYQCFVDNAFNKNVASIKNVDIFLKNKHKGFSDTAIARLLAMQVYNYGNIYEYAKAAATSDRLLKEYPNVLQGYELKDAKDNHETFNALKGIPAQTIEPHKDVLVPIHQDQAGWWKLKVKSAGDEEEFIFDTGAGISTISESVADRLKVKRTGTFIPLDAIQGKTLKAGVGVADITIGTLTIRNVVFSILPDSMLQAGDAVFPGILGYPVMKQLKEMQISKKGTLKIPAKTSQSKLHNLAMDGYTPMIYIVVNGDTLIGHFDTGADGSYLYSPYYDRYKDKILAQGKLEETGVGGAGGVKNFKMYRMKDIPFKVAGKDARFDDISIFTEPLTDVVSQQLVYGNFGEDMISQFESMTINFEDMFLSFN